MTLCMYVCTYYYYYNCVSLFECVVYTLTRTRHVNNIAIDDHECTALWGCHTKFQPPKYGLLGLHFAKYLDPP